MDDNKSFDSSKESETRFSSDIDVWENMKKIKEKRIQRINQVERELNNKLDILVIFSCTFA
jgi:hypothetical protein